MSQATPIRTSKKNTSSQYIQEFLNHESTSGLLLMFSATLAIILANSPLSEFYSSILDTPVAIQFGAFQIFKPLLLWVNDGLMAIFFFLVGLELKREFLDGELSDRSQIALPAIGALGGMLIPALVYALFNYQDPVAIRGWAIPAATDIAFALGILSLLGNRVPVSLKVFLTSLAIFDDLGAIIIIALFYTSKVSFTALLIAMTCICALFLLNRSKVIVKSPYILIGLIMWAALLKSGVHATLAGVILALFIPMYESAKKETSPVRELEHDLHFIVALFILPFFAFCNAGIDLRNIGVAQILHPVPMGIALGLLAGKQLGIFGFCYLAIKLKLAELPESINLSSLYGVSALAGVGFTMSLFIGSLAFEDFTARLFDERVGILLGSIISGVIGYCILRWSLRSKNVTQ